jgi:hypothetical protein
MPLDRPSRSYIRFDYGAGRANPTHAAAHFTMNAVDCRVPCAAPLRLGVSVDFIFRHFYPRTFDKLPWLRAVPKRKVAEVTVTEEERSRLHLNWPTV